MSVLPTRDTARGLVLDPDGRLFLIAYEAARDVDPARPGLRRFWFTPGGGLEPGETHAAGLSRELAEEIGVLDAAVGAPVARREVDLTLFRGRASRASGISSCGCRRTASTRPIWPGPRAIPCSTRAGGRSRP